MIGYSPTETRKGDCMDDDIKFIDGETYKGGKGEGITFKQIVLNQVSRITKLMSKEFHGGYYNEKVKPLGGDVPIIERTYIEDSREQFKNSVNCLYDLLYPQFDKQMEKDVISFENERKDKINEWNTQIQKNEMAEDTAKTYRAELHRILLRALMNLLDRLDYLKEGEVEE